VRGTYGVDEVCAGDERDAEREAAGMHALETRQKFVPDRCIPHPRKKKKMSASLSASPIRKVKGDVRWQEAAVGAGSYPLPHTHSGPL
jgi:hypothetical protein